MKKFTFLFLLLAVVAIGYSQVLPDNWTGDSGIDTYQESTNIHGGTYSCKVDVNTGSQASTDMRHDEISVTAGDSYTYSIWVWTSAHVKARVALEWTGATITYGGYSNAGTSGFEQVTYSGTVPTGATGVKVGYRFYDQSGFAAPETQYVDDVTFESPTGTPITLANGDMESWPSGNQPPAIFNIAHTPGTPSPADAVSVSADVTDNDGSVSDVDLNWGTTSGSLSNSINMSNSGGDTYTTDTDIPAQVAGTTVYYEIVAVDNEAASTTSPEQSYYVAGAATTSLPYDESFDTDLGDCLGYSVSGATKYWYWNSGGFAEMNGYNSGELEEDWLILPGIDFNSYSDEIMTFDTYYNFGNDDADNYLKLMYSSDYPGTGDPSGSTWAELTYTQPSTNQTWTTSGDIDLSSLSGTAVYIAFKYNYNSGSYRDWRVDNILIQEVTTVPEPTNYPTAFGATTNSAVAITTDWTDAIGVQLPAGYLILANLTGNFTTTVPVDGTPVTDDTDMSDGAGAMNVAFGVETYQWTGLTPNTTYYFTIYPYTNSGVDIDYKTNETPPTANASTDELNNGFVIINEVDADNVGTDVLEFIELYDGGVGNTDLSGLVVVLFNGSDTKSYLPVADLDGYTTDANGYFVIGNALVPNVDLVMSNGFLQNGPDAVALFVGDETDFPNDTPVTITNLLDALVYDTDDADAPGLLVLLNPGEPQVNENGRGNKEEHSNQRIPNGSGGQRNTSTYDQSIPTPGAMNSSINTNWTGATDTDWDIAGNWDNGVPVSLRNVIIPDVANDPIISGSAVCNDLTMQDASSLDVNVDGTLTVYGGLYMPSSKSPETLANFTIKSDATGNGSVIITTVGSNGDYVTVERYIPAYSGSDDGWHTIASPVDNMTITGSNFYPGTNDDLYKWDEPNNIWENYKAGWGDDNLYATEGYLVAYETSATKNFYGLLTNWDWDLFPLSYTPTEGNGWHLLGNPFSSAIEWGTADWVLSNVGGVAQIWNDDGGNYISRNAGDIIPSTNGFFVQVSDATNSMTIPTSARVHDTQNNYKSSRVDEMDETLVLKITNDENTYYDVNRIGFRNDATEEWDIAFDAHKLYGSTTAPQLWTISNDEIFSQNYLPYVYESYQLPLNFRAGVNSTYHLNFEGVESFFPNSEIHLEDVLLDKIIDLREQQLYDFMASTTDDENRFILHFYGVTTTGDKPELNVTKIFSHQNTVYIQSGQMPKDAYRIEVFNVMGQIVYAEQMEPSTLGSFILNNKTGVYVVRVYSDKQTIVQKVMIK